jgi:hypothetical protein
MESGKAENPTRAELEKLNEVMRDAFENLKEVVHDLMTGKYVGKERGHDAAHAILFLFGSPKHGEGALNKRLNLLVAMAVDEEREACAALCEAEGKRLFDMAEMHGDSMAIHYTERGNQAHLDAEAIRARAGSPQATLDYDIDWKIG